MSIGTRSARWGSVLAADIQWLPIRYFHCRQAYLFTEWTWKNFLPHAPGPEAPTFFSGVGEMPITRLAKLRIFNKNLQIGVGTSPVSLFLTPEAAFSAMSGPAIIPLPPEKHGGIRSF